MRKISEIKFIMLLTLFIFMLPASSQAHTLSAAFTTVNLSEDETELIYSIDTLSLIEGIGGDKNEDSKLSKDELKAVEFRVEEWVEDSLILEIDGQQQKAKLKSLKLEKKGENDVVRLEFTYPAIAVGQTVKLVDGIFYQGQNYDYYNNFLSVNYNGQVSEAVLHGKDREWAMLLAETQQQQQDTQGGEPETSSTGKAGGHTAWTSFLTLGMEHILFGYDHLLFLFALLLRKQTFKQYAAVVTSFTIAHSITISLAVLGIVTLPSRLVEAVIAFSICYVALENVFRKELKHRWGITFLFGLIHGLGFASILKEMNIPKSDLAAALFNFNIGIEAVQLAIVLVLLPLLTYMFRLKISDKIIRYGSYGIFALGAIWLVQRLFM